MNLTDEVWQVCISDGKIPLKKKVAAVEKWGHCYKEVTLFLFMVIHVASAFKLYAENVIFLGDTGRIVSE